MKYLSNSLRQKRTCVAATLAFLLVYSCAISASSLSGITGDRPEMTPALQQALVENNTVRVIVTLNTPFLNQDTLSSASLGGEEINTLQQSFVSSLSTSSTQFLKSAEILPMVVMSVDRQGLAELLSHSQVVSVEEDRLYSPHLISSLAKIGGDQVHANGITGQGQTVAILDSGVDSSHEFLAGKTVAEACFSTTFASQSAATLCPNQQDEEIGVGAGQACAFNGCDHGTHVAGIAAGLGNSFNGVAKNADIIAIQVFSVFDDQGTCGNETPPCILSYTSDIFLGLEYVYSLRNTFNISAANMSLGGGLFTSINECDANHTALKSIIDLLRVAKIATVISSGNDSSSNGLGSPGCISTAISVGSTTDSDNVSSFSNSATWLSLLAPGSSITSSTPNNNYQTWNGTSMAAPHVAGAFALLAEAEPNSTVTQRLAALTLAGQPINVPSNDYVKPRIDLVNALARLQSTAVSPVDFILDNDSNGDANGSFTYQFNTNAYGGTQLRGDSPNDSFQFNPTFSETGVYRVSTWFNRQTSAADAVYEIAHASGNSTLNVDQSSAGRRWQELGLFQFNQGNNHTVVVSSNSGRFVADALRFELQEDAPLSIVTGVLPEAEEGVNYTVQLDAVGGQPPYQWQEIDSLPNGLTLDSSGEISGQPTVAGTTQFFVEVTDQANAVQSRQFELVVQSGTSNTELIIDNQDAATSFTGTWKSSSAPNPWQNNSVFNNDNFRFSWHATVNQTGQYDVYAWWTYHVNRSNNVPYRINHASGTSTVTVNQRDAGLGGQWVLLGSYSFIGNQEHIIEISSENGQASADAVRLVLNSTAPPALAIDTNSLPNGEENQPYNFTLVASGGTAPYAWSLTSPIPEGMSFSSTGVLSGTPVEYGTWHMVFEVTDQLNVTAEKTLSLDIDAESFAPLAISTSQIPDMQVAQSVNITLTAQGGQPPYSWDSLDSLPDGLAISSTGTIAGTPTQAGEWTFEIEVTDLQPTTARAVFTVTVDDVPGSSSDIIVDNQDANTTSTGNWRNSSGPSPWAGNSVFNDSDQQFRWLPNVTQSGTYEVYVWWTYHAKRSSNVPYTIQHANGSSVVQVDQSDNSLGGQWNLLGEYDFVANASNYVEVSSENGQASADAIRLVAVTSTPDPLQIVTGVLATGTVNENYSDALLASGGQPPYEWDINGTFPPGLNYTVEGTLSGVPSTAGTFNFSAVVTDQQNNQSVAGLSITIEEATQIDPLAIVNTTLANGQEGEAYNELMVASGGAPGYEWEAFGNLPPGVQLGTDGVYSGTPQQSGSWDFDVMVTDANSDTAQASYTLVIDEAFVSAEIIIDDTDANTSSTGNWKRSRGADPWQNGSVFNNNPETFTWDADITQSGTYEVYAWWTFSANRSNNVPYTISHDNGNDTQFVDQSDSALGGQWNLLGTYDFSSGSYSITVSGVNGQASADAVRLIRLGN